MSCQRWLNVNTWSCWFLRTTVFVTVGRNAPFLDASISRYTCIHIQLIVFIPIHPLHTFWDRCFMGSGCQHVVGFCGKRKEVGTLLMSNEVLLRFAFIRFQQILGPNGLLQMKMYSLKRLSRAQSSKLPSKMLFDSSCQFGRLGDQRESNCFHDAIQKVLEFETYFYCHWSHFWFLFSDSLADRSQKLSL